MSVNTYLTDAERTILSEARVGLAGAGGLGSNCAHCLVRAGLRHLTIVDFDVVNPSNLNRQFFFADQIGQKKVDALKANLLRIDPTAEITAVDLKLEASSVRTIFENCDIVVECFDDVTAKAMILSALLPTRKPLIAASGLAGWGRSNALVTRRIGPNLILVGDGETDVSEALAPQAPRVTLAAAHQANAVLALLLHEELGA